MKKKVCVFTGSRAEYGLLFPLMKKIKEDKELELQIIASGMHLSPEFGLTYKDIEKDGFKINDKIEILLSSDTSVGVSKSIGLAIISFSDALKNLKPDLLVVLGDRFEAFAIATTAYVMKIPIAHLFGGETTGGALDEGFRHSISKLSYLHFTSTEIYRKRLIQLGEHPNRVFNVGAIGLDNIRNLKFLSKKELEKLLNFELGKKSILFTYHPPTLDLNNLEYHLNEIFEALKLLLNLGYKIIITKSNSDEGGRLINKYIDKFSLINKGKVLTITNLGTLKYLSVMKNVTLVMGNSSSGIVEAPSLKVPTVNIGDRQQGRIKGNSIVDCYPTKEEILKAVKIAEKINRKKITNPYDSGFEVSQKILNIIKKFLFGNKILLKKKFYDINWGGDNYG